MTKQFKYLAAIIGSTLLAGCAPVLETGADDATSDAIISGKDDHGDPAVVWIRTGLGYCSGTYIAPTVILTAAHCFSRYSAGLDTLRVYEGFDTGRHANDGSAWQDDPSPNVAKELHVDPAFHVPYADGHDLAVVIMEQPHAAFVPLSAPGSATYVAPEVGDRARFVGYGDTKDEGGVDGYKHEVKSKLDAVDPLFVHAGSKRGAICEGDSGGPVFLGDQLVAVTSWGPGRCVDGNYFTRVDAYHDWIARWVDDAASGRTSDPWIYGSPLPVAGESYRATVDGAPVTINFGRFVFSTSFSLRAGGEERWSSHELGLFDADLDIADARPSTAADPVSYACHFTNFATGHVSDDCTLSFDEVLDRDGFTTGTIHATYRDRLADDTLVVHPIELAFHARRAD